MPVIIPQKLFPLIVAEGSTEIHLPKSKIFTQGEVANHFYIVIKGRVRVYTITQNGQERTIEILETGRIFGDSSFLVNSRRTVTIEAVITSEVIRCDTEKLIELCTKSTPLMRLIFQHMAQTCNYLTHQIIQGSHYDSQQKVADFLFNESTSRGTNMLPYTQEEIAASTSLNRVTVSRVISKLKQQEIIGVKYGYIEIINRHQLRKLLPDDC